METPWYQGVGRRRGADERAVLPPSLLGRHADPAGYRADRGLVDAVNVALHLGQPLLLTGQPGTGKTQLAYSLAWELGFGEPLEFETKSTSVARDLFYTYDALGRFHAVHTGEGSAAALDYIGWNALGHAILYANEPAKVAALLAAAEHPGRRRSVVLIDEIDKAPRDFPNDLLNEVEGMYFRVPEMGNVRVAADCEMRPVLVLTSNSEKNLAEAFLRRCVFYHIPFPEEDRLRDIVHVRIGEEILGDRELLDDALEIFAVLRDPSAGLLKKPSTGELLAWLRVLTAGPHAVDGDGLRQERLVEPTLCALVKTVGDRPKARALVLEWLNSKRA